MADTKLRLHVVPAQGGEFDHSLDRPELVIGRSSDSDLVLADRFLSRRHSRLYRENGVLWIEDLGSRNGTWLNGLRIEAPSPVRSGDVIKISGSTVTLREDRSAPGSDSGREHTILLNASKLLEDRATSTARRIEGEEALRRYAERVDLLNDVHRALGSSIELQEILGMILDRVFDHLRPEQGVILLKQPDGEFEQVASRSVSRAPVTSPVSRSLIREVAEKGMAALVMDMETDERFATSDSILGIGIRSLVAAPLLAPEGSLGMIVLSSKAAVRQFTEEDTELLVSLAGVAALSLRNVRLAEEAAERRRMEKELNLARQIQKALLPARLPDLPGHELLAVNIPSRGVSGDYYQVVERAGGKECVVMIADVSGKGMAASLLTASLEALAIGPIEDGRASDDICTRLSRRLFDRTPPERYATAFIAIVEPGTGHLTYTNAGHNPGLVVRAGGSVDELDATGMPIGLVPEAEYAAERVDLGLGDTLFLYTDGITEAMNPEDEEYGLERLVEVCRQHRAATPRDLVEAIAAGLDAFTRGVPYQDDRTVVVLRRSARA